MRNLVIMPAMANNRERMNLGEYAEEATIIMDEPVRPANHFIEANTQEATLHHLKHDCITPVFSKDNELTINHAAFVETIQDAAQSFFSGERVEQADIRVSHIIKGRIPEAIHKPANQLLESWLHKYLLKAMLCLCYRFRHSPFRRMHVPYRSPYRGIRASEHLRK